MKGRCSAVLALWMVVAGASAADLPGEKRSLQPGPEGSLSVATFNVLYLNRDLPALVATIREADADLVALQETNDDSEQYLRRHLGLAYPHLRFRPSKGKSNGFGFLSRQPLGEAEFLGLQPDGRGGWMIEVGMGTNQIQVISVHLTTPRISPSGTVADMIKSFAGCEQIHRQELAPILARITAARPTIVLGDFNSFSFGVAVTALVEHGLIDSFASVTPEPEKHGTWLSPHGLGPNKNSPLRLDYILHDTSFKTRASRVIRSPASDHALVVSRLER